MGNGKVRPLSGFENQWGLLSEELEGNRKKKNGHAHKFVGSVSQDRGNRLKSNEYTCLPAKATQAWHPVQPGSRPLNFAKIQIML